MTHTEIRAAITALKGKVKDLERKGDRASLDLKAEIVEQINEYWAQLPEGRAVTHERSLSRSQGAFKNIGEQLLAIRNAGMPGAQPDYRLHDIQAAAAGLNETVPSEGGFLIQQDFSTSLLTSAFTTGILAQRCMRIQISGNSNSIKLPAFDETSRVTTRFGGVSGFWLSEAAEKTASKPKFRSMELSLKKLIGLCFASDEVLQDASVLNTVIPQAFAAEFGFLLDEAILNGTGAGQPLGILNAGSLISVTPENGQKSGTIVAENVFKMHARLLASGDATSCWLINRNTLPQLYAMSLSVGTGGVPIYLPANGVSGLPYSTLFGRPVVICEQCATLGTVGDIILADLTGGYVLAEKGGIQADMSIHVRFVYDESCFRFVLRVDGQPVLATAITPFKGAGATQSHFVALATR